MSYDDSLQVCDPPPAAETGQHQMASPPPDARGACRFAAVDVESSGLDPHRHHLVSVCLIADSLGSEVPPADLPRLECWVRPLAEEEYVWSLGAMHMHKAYLHLLCDRKVTQIDGRLVLTEVELSLRLKHWFRDHFPGIQKVTFAGKNPAFDVRFLRGVLGSAGVAYHHRAIDPAAWYLRDDDAEVPDLSTCLSRAGLEPTALHTAWGDCEDIVQLIRHARAK